MRLPHRTHIININNSNDSGKLIEENLRRRGRDWLRLPRTVVVVVAVDVV